MCWSRPGGSTSRLAGIREALPQLQHILLVGGEETFDVAGTDAFARALGNADSSFEIQPTDPEEIALLHFTSGTTGRPKGALHVHEAIVAHYEATGVEIPESDYTKLVTLDGCVEYLGMRLRDQRNSG